VGHRQWAGGISAPRHLDPSQLQIARTNVFTEAARIGVMPPDLGACSSYSDPKPSFRSCSASSSRLQTDLGQASLRNGLGGKLPPMTAVGRCAFPTELRLLAGPGCSTKIGHKFMRLRAMELAGSAVAGAAGAQAEYRAAKPRQSARTRRCTPAHKLPGAQNWRAPPCLARQDRQLPSRGCRMGRPTGRSPTRLPAGRSPRAGRSNSNRPARARAQRSGSPHCRFHYPATARSGSLWRSPPPAPA